MSAVHPGFVPIVIPNIGTSMLKGSSVLVLPLGTS